MKKIFLSIICSFFILSAFAQEKKTVIHLDELSENQKENLTEIVSTDGWVLIKSGEKNLGFANFSNKDYVLFFNNCASKNKSEFLIEYSNTYRDGGYGGIDFLCSKDNDYKKVEFILDNKNFQNPFKNYEKKTFDFFFDCLKKSEDLTINIYDENDSGKLRLARSIHFKLKNGDLLDLPLISCEESTTD